ncbi:MAG TPA: DapH/DapD/GlmU-related protein [Phycisphaerales bacterium]|nr:DapH/DapD/GlmU-related protein [Phycisphaerales bacterium]
MVELLNRVMKRLAHARLSRRLGALGPGSMVVRPELITGGKGIFLGAGVYVMPHARLECVPSAGGGLGRIEIGDATVAQLYLHIGAAESVRLGRRVLLAGRVYISDHDHAWPPGEEDRLVSDPVEIGDECWLGEGCAVLKGVTLGPRCVVGANAVVTRSAPAGSMLAGVPARVIKRYDDMTGRWVRVGAEPERPEREAPAAAGAPGGRR